MQFQFASDIARYFIEGADRATEGAGVFNIGTPSASVTEVIELILAAKPGARITGRKNDLPFPAGLDGDRLRRYLPDFLETPLPEGIQQTIVHFERCLETGRIA
jgi:nucleoside-diphosphate-sugar epimerase